MTRTKKRTDGPPPQGGDRRFCEEIMTAKQSYLRGLRAGIPIGLGYLSVSFTFGILSVSLGLFPWQALIISMCTLTSAGQLAGVQGMAAAGGYLSMLVAQLTINMRYSFMSVSLSQKADGRFRGVWRWILGFFITDEIFAVASAEREISRSFFFGLATLPYIGWASGTLLGAVMGDVLPPALSSALCIGIYGMFVAIVAPPASKEKPLLFVVLISLSLSCLFYFLPPLSAVEGGLAVSISAIVAAGIGVLFFPIDVEKEESADE